MAHLTRKSYSTVKQQLQTSAGYSPLLLSEMDTIFMATYAAGNIINGKLGDTFNPTTILAIGLFGSGACLLLMTLLVLLDVEHYSAMLGNVCILVIYFLFGFFQATGGPVGTAVMGNWFCDPASIKARGTIFGFWTCHQYMGDISAALLTAWVLGIGCPYWYALFIPAVCNISWAFLTMRLVADPYDMGIITPEVQIRLQKNEAKHKEMAEKGQADYEIDDGPKPITYLAALQIPMVAQYAFAFGFFKLTNYVLFFWLPYFLGKAFDPVTANLIASLYSVGMMPGGIIVGYVRHLSRVGCALGSLSHHFHFPPHSLVVYGFALKQVSDLFGGRRAVVIGTFMCALIVFLVVFALYSESGLGPAPLLFMLACMGILVGGYVSSCRLCFRLMYYAIDIPLTRLLDSRLRLVSILPCPAPTTSSRRPSRPTWPRTRASGAATRAWEPSPASSTGAAASRRPLVCWRSGPSRRRTGGARCGSTSLGAPRAGLF